MTPAEPEGVDVPLERALAGRILPLQRCGAAEASSPVECDLTSADHPAPGAVVSHAVIEALEAGETHYTARTGIATLREAIAEMSSSQGFTATPATTVVTNGGSEALFIALQTLVSAGDSVMLLEPVAPHVRMLVTFLGGVAASAPSVSGPDLDGAAAVVIPVGSGIDGRIVPDGDLVAVLEAAATSGATVILDRSHVPDCYVEHAPFSWPELTANVVTIGSFSGAFGLAGWRAGYFTAPENLMPRLAGLKESMSISTTTPTQHAALAVLENRETILRDARERFVARRDQVMGLLERHGVSYLKPDVYPGLLIDARLAGIDDVALAERLEDQAGIRVEPASIHGASLAGHLRIDLRASLDLLEAGVPRIAAFLNEEGR